MKINRFCKVREDVYYFGINNYFSIIKYNNKIFKYKIHTICNNVPTYEIENSTNLNIEIEFKEDAIYHILESIDKINNIKYIIKKYDGTVYIQDAIYDLPCYLIKEVNTKYYYIIEKELLEEFETII